MKVRWTMIEKLRKELRELAEQQQRRDRVEQEIERLQQEESALWREEYQIRLRCTQAAGEIAALEQTSLRSLYYGLTGRKAQLLAEAQVRLREAEAEQRDIRNAMEECSLHLKGQEAARKGFGDLDRRYRETFCRAKELLVSQTGPEGKAARLESAIGELDRVLRETDRAIGAGGLALQAARRAAAELEDARRYGLLDLAGGGMVSGLAKHRKLDEARAQTEALRARVADFNSAMTDANLSLHLGQDRVEGFVRFADLFLDGWLVDWTVQRRMNDAVAEVRETEATLRTAVGRLESLHRTLTHNREELAGKLERLVLGEENGSAAPEVG